MDLKSKLSTGLLRGEGGVAGPLSSKRLLKKWVFFYPLPYYLWFLKTGIESWNVLVGTSVVVFVCITLYFAKQIEFKLEFFGGVGRKGWRSYFGKLELNVGMFWLGTSVVVRSCHIPRPIDLLLVGIDPRPHLATPFSNPSFLLKF